MKLTMTLLATLFIWISSDLHATQLSVAGFFHLPESGREVFSFNQGWRFFRGDISGAEGMTFNDSSWEGVNTPHTVQLIPSDASGGRNYQGVVWYRKQFTVPANATDRELTLHFEAIIGKQQFYVNGVLVKENNDGYLPVTIDLTKAGVKAGDICLVAVKADNSGNKSLAQGIANHGGIYRDVWLIMKNQIAITDAAESRQAEGGGVFVHFENVSERSATIHIQTEIANNSEDRRAVTLELSLVDKSGRVVRKLSGRTIILPGESNVLSQRTTLLRPNLWSPENPYLYELQLQVKEGRDNLDGGMIRFGIRNVEFRGKDGLFLNGKPIQLMGVNRHQDFAYVGIAVPNSQQWRDAKRLRDAGFTAVRMAHYPADPAFMDACDELGLFVITQDMNRRDRNHPSLLVWKNLLAAQNAMNRAARHWGERPMKLASLALAESLAAVHQTTDPFVGTAFSYAFDYQQASHPEPFWGGISDAFRQPKYAYHLFKSQQNPRLSIDKIDSGPMVFILNEMTPFSDSDVVVFSNCDSVRLTAYGGKRVVTKPVVRTNKSLAYAPVVFENQFNFEELREISIQQNKPEAVGFLVEGFIGGRVVCSEQKMPADRSSKIRLRTDHLNRDLVADGSDFIVVIAEITDDKGNVRRLARESILFSIEGEGEIIGDASIQANPRQVEFGTAPVLIRSTTMPGKIRVKASVLFGGEYAPASAEIEFNSVVNEMRVK